MIPDVDGSRDPDGAGTDPADAGDAAAGTTRRPAERRVDKQDERARGATVAVHRLSAVVTAAFGVLHACWSLARMEELQGLSEDESFERYLTTVATDHFHDHPDQYNAAEVLAKGLAKGLGIPDSQASRTDRDRRIARDTNEADRAYIKACVDAGLVRPEVLRDMPRVDD